MTIRPISTLFPDDVHQGTRAVVEIPDWAFEPDHWNTVF
ncbi:MAG: hypothetical protein RIQ56_180, partial [Candidatus Parcubacteria bacterium]